MAVGQLYLFVRNQEGTRGIWVLKRSLAGAGPHLQFHQIRLDRDAADLAFAASGWELMLR